MRGQRPCKLPMTLAQREPKLFCLHVLLGIRGVKPLTSVFVIQMRILPFLQNAMLIKKQPCGAFPQDCLAVTSAHVEPKSIQCYKCLLKEQQLTLVTSAKLQHKYIF